MEVLELTSIGSEDVKIISFFLCNEYLCCRDAIVSWLKKKTGPGLHNITTTEEAERILTDEDKIVLGYLESLVVWFLSIFTAIAAFMVLLISVFHGSTSTLSIGFLLL